MIAIASIVLAAVAACIQDEIEHIVGYSIVGDAGVVPRGGGVDAGRGAPARHLDPRLRRGPQRLAAWAAATRTTFFTGRVGDLRGWAVRSPLLAVVFGLVGREHRVPGLAGVRGADPTWSTWPWTASYVAPVVTLATFAPLL